MGNMFSFSVVPRTSELSNGEAIDCVKTGVTGAQVEKMPRISVTGQVALLHFRSDSRCCCHGHQGAVVDLTLSDV